MDTVYCSPHPTQRTRLPLAPAVQGHGTPPKPRIPVLTGCTYRWSVDGVSDERRGFECCTISGMLGRDAWIRCCLKGLTVGTSLAAELRLVSCVTENQTPRERHARTEQGHRHRRCMRMTHHSSNVCAIPENPFARGIASRGHSAAPCKADKHWGEDDDCSYSHGRTGLV